MDKKKKTILLLVIACSIWGYSALKWFDYFVDDNDTSLAFTLNDSMIPEIIFEEKQDFVLNANYPDPFLKNTKYKSSSATTNNHNYSPSPSGIKKTVTLPPVKTTFKWPKLKYSGFILSKGEKLALLNLSGADVLVKKGDIIKKLVVLEIYSDSINLRTGDNFQTVLKK